MTDNYLNIRYMGIDGITQDLPVPIATDNPDVMLIVIGRAELVYYHSEVITISLPDCVIVPWYGFTPSRLNEPIADIVNGYLFGSNNNTQTMIKVDPEHLAYIATMVVGHYAIPFSERPAITSLLINILEHVALMAAYN